MLHGTTSEME